MRLMEWIRRKGGVWLGIFLVFMTISVFAGLGVGSFSFRSCDQLGLNQNTGGATARTYLVNEGDWEGVALKVNGRTVDEHRYQQTLARVMDMARSGSDDDPMVVLQAHGYTADVLIREETMMAKGEELGVKVTSKDLADAKNEAITQFLTKEEETSGNVVGDLAKSLGTARDRKAAFNRYLEVNGLTEEMWNDQARRELFMRNTTDALQAAADEAKKVIAEQKKAEVDEKLAAGESFQELAKQYSDDPSAPQGGDVGTWVQRGLLFDEEIENKLFDTPVGEYTDWFDIPAGFQRFYVYDKLEPSGPEFEAAKETLTATIRETKGAEYQPSDEELAKEYEKIKFYQILLSTTDQGKAQDEAQKLYDAAIIEINDPMVLAFQALSGEKLQPPAETTAEDLIALAKNTPATAEYDFSLIQDLLDKGRPKDAAADAAAGDEAEAAGDTTSEEVDVTVKETDAEVVDPAAEPADAAAEADATAEADAAAPADEAKEEIPDLGFPEQEETKPPVPVYALAVGLLKLGLQTDEEQGATVNNYLIGKTYLDWLDDEEQAASQPLDRDKAREEAEENLARAVETYNYNPLVFAVRGLNLAWLDRPDEAREALAEAQRYAPRQTGPVWDSIRKAYEILGDEAKLKEIDTIIAELRQEQLRQAIEKAQQSGQGGMANIDLGQLNLGEPTEAPPQGGAPQGDGGAAPEGESGGTSTDGQ